MKNKIASENLALLKTVHSQLLDLENGGERSLNCMYESLNQCFSNIFADYNEPQSQEVKELRESLERNNIDNLKDVLTRIISQIEKDNTVVEIKEANYKVLSAQNLPDKFKDLVNGEDLPVEVKEKVGENFSLVRFCSGVLEDQEAVILTSFLK